MTCCRCNRTGRCRGCSCVKAGSLCQNCLPSRRGQCTNANPNTHDLAISTSVSVKTEPATSQISDTRSSSAQLLPQASAMDDENNSPFTPEWNEKQPAAPVSAACQLYDLPAPSPHGESDIHMGRLWLWNFHARHISFIGWSNTLEKKHFHRPLW